MTRAPSLLMPGPRTGTLLDAAIAAGALTGTLLLLAHGGIAPSASSRDLDLLGLVLAICSSVPLIGWRRYPIAVFVVTGLASVGLAGLGYPLDLLLGPTVALYLLAARRDPPLHWTSPIVLAMAGTAAAYLAATAAAGGGFPTVELTHGSLAWALAWFAGDRTRLRHEHMSDLDHRAARAEREAERERMLATAEERARIARDLHDSAGHAISLIAVRAGAARLRHDHDPDRSLLALEAIEELARHTVDEIDQIVGTMRENTVANEVNQAPAGLASLDTLVRHHTAAGLRVSIHTSGAPQELSSAADIGAYRILQEALTNAARHGAGTARIDLAFNEAAIELTVTNPTLATGTPRTGGGHGLVGMHERATLLGGSLEADDLNGSFRVRARIPYKGRSGWPDC